MSQKPLKPVSDQAREFLALIGETPQDHQKQFLNKIYKEKHSTEKPPLLSQLNQRVEAALSLKIPISELAKKAELASPPAPIWTPTAYVLFVRKTFCKNCKSWTHSMDQPSIFLEQNSTKKDPSNPKLFTPVKDLSEGDLERRQIINFVTTSHCQLCFLGASKCPPQNLKLKPTALSPSEEVGSESISTEPSPSIKDGPDLPL
jgi:hypothetical protein